MNWLIEYIINSYSIYNISSKTLLESMVLVSLISSIMRYLRIEVQ